jgi:hypothetical protein
MQPVCIVSIVLHHEQQGFTCIRLHTVGKLAQPEKPVVGLMVEMSFARCLE